MRLGTMGARHNAARRPTVSCRLGPPCSTLGPGTALCLHSRAVPCSHARQPTMAVPACGCKGGVKELVELSRVAGVMNMSSSSHSSAPLRPHIVAAATAPSQRCLAQTPSSHRSCASHERRRAIAVVAAPRGEDTWGRSGLGLPGRRPREREVERHKRLLRLGLGRGDERSTERKK
jgi:hypothetical protein